MLNSIQGSDSIIHVAIVMTCHNRANLSARLVKQLNEQASASVQLSVIAVDDGSTDDTAERLIELGARVIRGNGNLFWAGGMSVAHRSAIQENPDIILWINDDLVIAPDAIDRLIQAYKESGVDVIQVGSVVSPLTGSIVYGGRIQDKKKPLSFRLIDTDFSGSETDTFNGNFVGIPRSVYKCVPFPKGYRHGYADLVYGILASRKGFNSVIMDRPIGYNDRNDLTGKMFRSSVPLISRIRFAVSPFGMPIREQWKFAVLNTGIAAPKWFLRSYVRVLFPNKNASHS